METQCSKNGCTVIGVQYTVANSFTLHVQTRKVMLNVSRFLTLSISISISLTLTLLLILTLSLNLSRSFIPRTLLCL